MIYEYIRNIIDEMHEDHQEKSKLFNFMLAGGTAKFTACVIAYPHGKTLNKPIPGYIIRFWRLVLFITTFSEVIRTRLREESSQKRSWASTIVGIYQDGGFRGYYRGLSVQVCLF